MKEHSTLGAPLARPDQAPGAFLSLDPNGDAPLIVPADFAADGSQATILGGRVQLFSAQSPAYLNGVSNPGAATADQPGVSNPRAISINNAFGRLWPASAPAGMNGPGASTILDPSGVPLAGAPSKLAGGIFMGALTNRQPQQSLAGSLSTGAVATTFLGKSPDDSGRAVFAVVLADGSVVQAHSEKNVDGLAPAGTITPLLGGNEDLRAGSVLSFEPVRILYITDPLANAVVALRLEDDRTTFLPGEIRRIESAAFDVPVDIAPAKPETEDTDWASNTTLEEDADLYVANRGDNTIVRLRQDGTVVAVRRVTLPEGQDLGTARLNGIAVAPDGRTMWVTVSGSLPGYDGLDGAVLELPAFGA